MTAHNLSHVNVAGDSRAVLCRADGTAHELSLDHKPGNVGLAFNNSYFHCSHLFDNVSSYSPAPTKVTELQRIEAAGGFVNAVGRVNGNLNLSRCNEFMAVYISKDC